MGYLDEDGDIHVLSHYDTLYKILETQPIGYSFIECLMAIENTDRELLKCDLSKFYDSRNAA